MSKKGCIQINLGGTKYTFKDVDISSTSLNDISKTLSSHKKYREIIENIVSTSSEDINEIEESDTVNANIGDYAVGNATVMGLSCLSRINKPSEYSGIYMLSNLLDYNDNNILFSPSIESSAVYIGNNRDFIVLNPNAMDSTGKIAQALSFVYASKQASKVNSSVFKTLDFYVKRILSENLEFEKELSGLDEVNAAKKLLILLQSSDSELSKEILSKLSQDINLEAAKKLIKSAIKSKSPESIKEALDKSEHILGKSENISQLLDKSDLAYLAEIYPEFSENKGILSKRLLLEDVKALSKLRDETTTINGNKYKNSFIIKILSEMEHFNSNIEVDDNLFSNAENIPNKYKQYYMQYQLDKDRSRLLNDLFFNEDPEFSEIFNDGDVIDKILFVSPEIEVNSESSFIPKIDQVNVDPGFSLDTRRVRIDTNNGHFNSDIKSNKEKSVQLVVTDKYEKFATIGNKSADGGLKIYINPNFQANDSDVEEVRNAITIKTGKNAGNAKRTLWYVTKSGGKYSTSAVNNLRFLFEQLNTNRTLIYGLSSTGFDSFGIDVAKAAIQAGISTTIYPEYYGASPNKGYLSYLDEQFNLSFSQPDIVKNFTADEFLNLTDNQNPGLFSEINKSEGDVIVIKNNVTQSKIKGIVDKVYSFNFNRRLNDFLDMYSINEGSFRLGTVLAIKEDGKIINATIIGKSDSEYTIVTDKGYTRTIPKSEVVNEENIYPLYLSDIKYIDGVPYYYNSMGIIKDGVLTKQDHSVYLEFFNNELREIFDRTEYDNYENFINDNFGTISQLKKNRFYGIKPYSRATIRSIEYGLNNYSNANMLEIIGNSLTRQGINVKMFTGEDLEKVTGISGLRDKKAFIHNGVIFLNKDKCTEDSPIHELMHLLLGQYKATEPENYQEMLRTVPELEQFETLKSTYSELTPNDYIEEVLVHAMTDMLMGRILDYGRLDLAAKNLDIKKLATKLLAINPNSMKYYRETPNSEFLNTLLQKLLIDGDSKLLDNLTLGINESEIILDGRVSNVKSKLKKENNLKIECE